MIRECSAVRTAMLITMNFLTALFPYKHYEEAEVIAGVLDEVILPDDLDSEDYPSFSTMLRWLQWFRENRSVWKDTADSRISNTESGRGLPVFPLTRCSTRSETDIRTGWNSFSG
ncbi:hypothetical protein [Roseburia intestinalis]